MIAATMIYALAIASLIGLAALAASRMLLERDRPSRGVWAAALVISLVLPAVMIASDTRAPRTSISAIPLQQPRSAAPARPKVALRAPAPIRITWPQASQFDGVLIALWIAGSAAMLLLFGAQSLRLRRTARGWPREQFHGEYVRVSERIGPAVLGISKPVIVIPRWLSAAPASEGRMVLAHEHEHIRARDPALLAAALVVVALMPWNVPLWWQLRRLRFAAEVDCDRRVLSGGVERRAYGEVLLSIGAARPRRAALALALVEPASQLQRRIAIMLSGARNRGILYTGALLALSMSLVAAAAQLSAPSAAPAAELRKAPPDEGATSLHIARIEAVLKQRYPELLNRKTGGTPLVTMLFNADGTIDRTQFESYAGRPAGFTADANHFVRFGLAPEQVGYVGVQGVRSAGSEILVVYSEHRPPAGRVSSLFPDTRETDRALAERYFPRALKGEGGSGGLWILLDHEGRVLRTGRESFPPDRLPEFLAARYPGIQAASWTSTPVATAQGSDLDLHCLWLAPGSPAPDR